MLVNKKVACDKISVTRCWNRSSPIFPKLPQNVYFSKLPNMSPHIWATFVRKLEVNIGQNSPIWSHCVTRSTNYNNKKVHSGMNAATICQLLPLLLFSAAKDCKLIVEVYIHTYVRIKSK